MTKIEEKLIELGYTFTKENNNLQALKIIFHMGLNIFIDDEKIIDFCVYTHTTSYSFQKQIDHLQQAFNVLQNDLEVLKEYE